MNGSRVIIILGLFVAAGTLSDASSASPQEEKNQPAVSAAKLPRKAAPPAPRAASKTPRPVAPDPASDPSDDASPPAIFQDEPTAADAHDHEADELDRKLTELVEQLRRAPDDPAEAAPAQAQHPLLRVGQRMRDSEIRIARLDPGEQTQRIQKEIVDDLDKLLAQLKNQASTCSNCNGAGCKACQQIGKQQPSKPQQPKNSGKPGNNPRANQAAIQAGKTTPQQAQLAERMNLLKDIWGHLPQRRRELLEQMALDLVFLPQYDSLIKSYFEALLEHEQLHTPER